ncbi:hypothetical protein Acr_17g0010510 [Actinidia rufa]|uniref:Uncharacterized protein n=1 Tax=Actinidia rufa TaxID=165716 RepID=A0A7J0G3Y2_9ERIC|nr:hypothetical protein Acr_17g0010510 [Actinidia rufa]
MGGVVFCRDSLASPSMALYSFVEEKSPAHLSKGEKDVSGDRYDTRSNMPGGRYDISSKISAVSVNVPSSWSRWSRLRGGLALSNPSLEDSQLYRRGLREANLAEVGQLCQGCRDVLPSSRPRFTQCYTFSLEMMDPRRLRCVKLKHDFESKLGGLTLAELKYYFGTVVFGGNEAQRAYYIVEWVCQVARNFS